MKYKFNGNGFTFTLMNLGLALLVGFTFGLLSPYWLFWNVKYIIENVEVQK